MRHPCLAVALLALAAPPAWASPWSPPPPPADAEAVRANAMGVQTARSDSSPSASEQETLDEAVRWFERALTLWDHPGVRFNLAVTHTRRGRPTDALRHLWHVARHGGLPLDVNTIATASWLDTKLRDRVALLVVTADADLTVTRADDPGGAPLLAAAGLWRALAAPAPTTLLVTRPGAPPIPVTLTPRAGLETRVALRVDAAGHVRADVATRAPTPADWDAAARATVGFAVRWPSPDELAAWVAAEEAATAHNPPHPRAAPWGGAPGDRCVGARGPLARICADRDAAHAALREIDLATWRLTRAHARPLVDVLFPAPPADLPRFDGGVGSEPLR